MQQQQYHPVAQYLHWAIAGMIVLQFVLANLADDAGTPLLELALLANHKSVGVTIFVLAIARLVWRLRQGVPRSLPMPGWQFIASRVSHWSMYGLIFLLPITGWLMSSAAAYSVSWFNLVALPDLVLPDPELEEVFEEIHETLATLLFVIATIHIVAAIKHSLFDKDGALSRISSAGPVLLFVAVVAVGVTTLTRVGDGSVIVARPGAERASAPVEMGSIDLEPWNIDYETSSIKFTANQAGAGFRGEWQEWIADIRFDETRLDASLFDVSVTVAAVETLDDERDMTMQDAEWFDAGNYPQVLYRANRFQRQATGVFEALGTLTVKGRNVPVTLEFTVSQDAGKFVLDGTSELDRLELGLGLGEWSDTRWIGRFVTVVVHVETVDQAAGSNPDVDTIPAITPGHPFTGASTTGISDLP